MIKEIELEELQKLGESGEIKLDDVVLEQLEQLEQLEEPDLLEQLPELEQLQELQNSDEELENNLSEEFEILSSLTTLQQKSGVITIQTHNGKIHSDETVAISLLTNYFSRKNIDVSVFRSRASECFPTSDILVDVGCIYDAKTFRFDHHQPSFNERWNVDSPTPLSSTGLIWRHFGKQIVEMFLSANSEDFDFSENYTEDTIGEIVDIIYNKIFLEIDANDNAIVLNNFDKLNIPEMINSINDVDTMNDEVQDENFQKAISLVGIILDIKFKEIIKGYFNFANDLEIVKKFDFDLGKPYVLVNSKIPTIFKCLNEIEPDMKIKFLIFFLNNEFTIKTRNKDNKKFSPICPILSENILREKLQHPEDIIFVHKGKFLAKSKTLETAIEIVELSVKNFVDLKTDADAGKNENLNYNKILGTATLAFLTLGIGYWFFKEKE